MCLSTITSRRTGTNLQETTVWKQFEIVLPPLRMLRSEWLLKSVNFEDRYTEDKIGVWIKATGPRRIKIDYLGKYYPFGFHGHKKRVKLWSSNTHPLIPVKFRRIHTIGTQGSEDVLVAYEMKIPKNWRKYVR